MDVDHKLLLQLFLIGFCLFVVKLEKDKYGDFTSQNLIDLILNNRDQSLPYWKPYIHTTLIVSFREEDGRVFVQLNQNYKK